MNIDNTDEQTIMISKRWHYSLPRIKLTSEGRSVVGRLVGLVVVGRLVGLVVGRNVMGLPSDLMLWVLQMVTENDNTRVECLESDTKTGMCFWKVESKNSTLLKNQTHF